MNLFLSKVITPSKLILFPILMISFLLITCTKDKVKTPDADNANQVNCDTVRYRYNATVKTIVTNNCAGCHSTGSSNGNLTDYNTLKAYAQSGSLVGSLKGQGYTQMPPGGKLSDCDIKGIQNWVTNGANND